jgi:hypothetical protein
MTLRLLPALLLIAPVTGCIYYESDGSEWDDEECADCDWWNDDDDTNNPDPGDTDDTSEPEPTYSFTLSPDYIVSGDADVALLTVEGDFDLGAVADVSVLGPVEVAGVLPRGEGLMLVLEADADAAPGLYHVVLDLQDGTAVLFDDGLEVVAPSEGCP